MCFVSASFTAMMGYFSTPSFAIARNRMTPVVVSSVPPMMPGSTSVRLVSAVELDRNRSEWALGDRARWTAEIINDEPGRVIGWQTLAGADIVSAGSVRFNEAGNNATDLVVHMQYSPPFGRLGASLAELFGKGATDIVEESLAAAKQAIESATPRLATEPSR